MCGVGSLVPQAPASWVHQIGVLVWSEQHGGVGCACRILLTTWCMQSWKVSGTGLPKSSTKWRARWTSVSLVAGIRGRSFATPCHLLRIITSSLVLPVPAVGWLWPYLKVALALGRSDQMEFKLCTVTCMEKLLHLIPFWDFSMYLRGVVAICSGKHFRCWLVWLGLCFWGVKGVLFKWYLWFLAQWWLPVSFIHLYWFPALIPVWRLQESENIRKL